MEQFLKSHTKAPNGFITDFFDISKEEYLDDEFIIDFNIIIKWLNVRKDNLKKILVDNFEINYDSTIEKIKHNHKIRNGAHYVEEITLTPDCFKELCMISQTSKAKEVRKYYLEIEKLIRKYYQSIQNKLYKEIGIIKNNQKPNINHKKGVIYVLKANNSTTTIYKLGRTKNLPKRLKTYNTGNANDVDPVFILEVDNIDQVENCIKNLVKDYQYRKYKEVYEIDLDLLKDAISNCDTLINSFKKYTSRKTIKAKIKKLDESENGLFLYIHK